MCDECALRFYVCSIFVDRVFVLFIFHHGDTLRSSDFSGAITRRESLRVPPEVTFVASPQPRIIRQSALTVAIGIGLEFILVLIVV